MRRARTLDSQPIRCSFCYKGPGAKRKLISNPGGSAHICDECIAVCVAIVEDDRELASAEQSHEVNPLLLVHPLASRLLSSVERWIRQESLRGMRRLSLPKCGK